MVTPILEAPAKSLGEAAEAGAAAPSESAAEAG